MLRLPPDATASDEVRRHELPGPAEPRLVVLERAVVPPGGRLTRLAVAADARLVDEPAGRLRPHDGALARGAGRRPPGGRRGPGRGRAAAAGPAAAGPRGASTRGAGGGSRPPCRPRSRPLTEDLNSLLEHGEAILARARLQAGNLAHALKTDLAVLANEVEGLTPANAAERAGHIRDRLERMRRHVDRHTARARAAAARGVPGVATDVGACAGGLARALGRLHADRGVAIALDVPPDLRFAGEEADLQEMLGNLMDNACKWARGRVRREPPA